MNRPPLPKSTPSPRSSLGNPISPRSPISPGFNLNATPSQATTTSNQASNQPSNQMSGNQSGGYGYPPYDPNQQMYHPNQSNQPVPAIPIATTAPMHAIPVQQGYPYQSNFPNNQPNHAAYSGNQPNYPGNQSGYSGNQQYHQQAPYNQPPMNQPYSQAPYNQQPTYTAQPNIPPYNQPYQQSNNQSNNQPMSQSSIQYSSSGPISAAPPAGPSAGPTLPARPSITQASSHLSNQSQSARHSRNGSNTQSPAVSPNQPVNRANNNDIPVITGELARPVNLRDPTELIDRCTDPTLNGVSDWSLNMRLIDLINNLAKPQPANQSNNQSTQSTSPAARQAKIEELINYLMKKVTSSSHSVGLVALALLEALVKNCPSTHAIVGKPAALNSIVAVLPKQIRDPSGTHLFTADHTNDVFAMERYDRILVVIQSWGKAFSHDDKHPSYAQVYKQLLNGGVKFAEPDRDELAPVFTPMPNAKLIAQRAAGIAGGRRSSNQPSQASSAVASAVHSPVHSPAHSSNSSRNSSAPTSPRSPPNQSNNQKADPPLIYINPPSFRDPELMATFASLSLLCELLDASTGPEHVSTDQLINEMLRELRRSQQTIRTKLAKPGPNDRVDELLACADMLQNAFLYYDGLAMGTMRTRNASDEARRRTASENLFVERSNRPTARRASSHDVYDHNVRIVREQQHIKPLRHQYETGPQSINQAIEQSKNESHNPSNIQAFSYAVSSPTNQSNNQSNNSFDMQSMNQTLPAQPLYNQFHMQPNNQSNNQSDRRKTWSPMTSPGQPGMSDSPGQPPYLSTVNQSNNQTNNQSNNQQSQGEGESEIPEFRPEAYRIPPSDNQPRHSQGEQ